MESYNEVPIPVDGGAIQVKDHKLLVPDNPIIPFIEGDGVGPDIWRAARTVFDAAVLEAYGGRRRVAWYEVFAGEKAYQKFNDWLPKGTLDAIRQFHVAIKGPLTTPVGGGIRSLNVTLRLLLDLYVCMRPVRYFPGVPSPMKHPELLNVVIFRENTEDVYAGIEWQEGTPEAHKVIEFLTREMGKKIRLDSGIGIKPMSVFGSKRLIRRAIQYAIDNGRRSVTLVHKGNIMKFTEGAFRDWGYQVAVDEFRDRVVTWDEVVKNHGGRTPAGKLLIQDVIADSMFQQLLLRSKDYDVIATANLNGDYLSDACAAQVGGLGMAPGANLGDEAAVFEATHGTAPKYAGLDKINPSSVVLSGVMMFDHLGWGEVGASIVKGIETTVTNKTVTYDLARGMENPKEIKCSEYATEVIKNLG